MKKGGQKRKSGRHERRIAKIFDEVYYPDAEGEFRRTPGSGGWDKRIAPGDIQPFLAKGVHGNDMIFDATFPFSIECKDWKDANVKHIFSGIYSKPSQIYKWIDQAETDAVPSGKIPVVVFKLYGTEDLVLMLMQDWRDLKNLFGLFHNIVYKVAGGPEEIIFCGLDKWLKWIDWEVYKLGR